MFNAIGIAHDARQPQPEATWLQAGAPRAKAAETGQSFLPAGTKLHEYQIEKVLGHGGFGITYLARDTMLDKPVAIKEYLPAHLAVRNHTHVSVRSPNEQRAFDWGRRQFLKEAQTLARFAHPNLVPVHRYFQANQTAYFVMAYVEGETLAHRLKADPQPSEEFLRSVLLPVMDGLKCVHRAGFLHRDIKPENILLTKDGTPVLIDFGAARVNVGSATQSTMCALTAGYAPLEQYGSAGHQGPWTDVYALGAVAYRAVSGRKPPDAVNRIHSDGLMAARKLGAGRYSTAFLEAIDWALALHPEERPRSLQDFQKALGGQVRRVREVATPAALALAVTQLRVTGPAKKAPALSLPWATAAAPLVALAIVGAAILGVRAPAQEPLPEVVATRVMPVELPAAPVSKPAPVATIAHAAAASAAESSKARPEPKPVAQMEALSGFQDCADCPAMTVLPAQAGATLAIGRFEVTADEYQQCVADQACARAGAGAHGNLPMTQVSFADAQAYAAWLSRRTGRRYRLPTEAEWEYAARSGTHSPRFWGEDPRRACEYANAKASATCRDGHAGLAAVGSYKPNWFDLYDMAGNVWEWTADCWREASAKAPAGCNQRATRGGSWRTPPEALRSTTRTPVAVATRSDTLGFRVVTD